MEKKLTTWEVLRYKFPANEYVLIEEVSDASGFSRSRSLDFMLINLWESRGLAVTGIERKSYRSDWLKELKNPMKQENHFKYCDYFYLLTDKNNVAKIEEIPPTWGWYHINDKQVLKTMKAAPKLKSIPIQRTLLCAMLKRAACKDKYVHVDTLEEAIQIRAENIKSERNFAMEHEASAYRELKERVEDFEKASGIQITYRWDNNAKKVGEAVRVLLNGGLKEYLEQLERIEQQVKNIYDSVEKDLLTLKQYNAE